LTIDPVIVRGVVVDAEKLFSSLDHRARGSTAADEHCVPALTNISSRAAGADCRLARFPSSGLCEGREIEAQHNRHY
jgi:hypothetical protein